MLRFLLGSPTVPPKDSMAINHCTHGGYGWSLNFPNHRSGWVLRANRDRNRNPNPNPKPSPNPTAATNNIVVAVGLDNTATIAIRPYPCYKYYVIFDICIVN